MTQVRALNAAECMTSLGKPCVHGFRPNCGCEVEAAPHLLAQSVVVFSYGQHLNRNVTRATLAFK
jgi:hypothetical protein